MRAKDPARVISARRGTYALVLASDSTGLLRVGRLGTMELSPGFYVYVGSAFGTGGLAARLGHHQESASRPHWHIDYLRAVCDLVEVWFTTEAVHREHAWAKALARMPGACLPMPGFGSSDCTCETHLIWFAQMPSAKAFGQRVRMSRWRMPRPELHAG